MIRDLINGIIYVENMQRAVDFYTKTLEFKLIRDDYTGSAFMPRIVYISAPKSDIEYRLIEVAENYEVPKEFIEPLLKVMRGGLLPRLGFSSRNVFVTYEDLKAKGVKFTHYPTTDNPNYASFKDDSGNTIDVYKRTSFFDFVKT
jgi:catechol 2,3-dioxygenase-like lactoylglutathione lyase family enzyme